MPFWVGYVLGASVDLGIKGKVIGDLSCTEMAKLFICRKSIFLGTRDQTFPQRSFSQVTF